MNSPCDLVVVGAHADDAELGAGGIIATATGRGRTVVIVDVTDGALATGIGPAERQAEAERAALVLGAERHNMGLPDRGVTVASREIELCVTLIRSLRPAVLLLPDPGDRHPDHGVVFELWRQALFSAGLARVGMGDPFRPDRVFTYGVSPGARPDLLVDVSARYGAKVSALDCYGRLSGAESDEFIASRSGSRDLVVARDRYYGVLAGVEYAEAVRPIGPLVLPGLV